VLLWNEVVIIVTVTLWGIASDYVGRKPIYVIALILIGLSLIIHSEVSTVTQLILVRVVFALGSAAATSMLTSLLADYPTEETRGRVAGLMGLMSGFGALLAVFFFLRIPSWAKQYTTVAGGKIMYWSAGGFILCSASVLFCGLSDKTEKENKHTSILVIAKEGFLAGRNPRIALSYFGSFGARGGSILVTTFLSLWITKYGANHGMKPEDALARAGMISGIAQTLAIVGAPFFGIGGDYFSRVGLQAVAAVFAAGGYFWIYSLDSPDAGVIYAAACLVGIGEIGMIISSQLLVAAASPKELRGSISGFFSLCGSVSILVCSKFGGWLFEHWTMTAPFFFVACWTVLVLVLSVALYLYERREAQRQPLRV